MPNIRNTAVFREARRLVKLVYLETRGFPKDERFLLVAQMRGCANSIGANLLEGSGRNTAGEFRQFVGYGTGSVCELEWHTMVAADLLYIDPATRDALMQAIHSMTRLLAGFNASLRPYKENPYAPTAMKRAARPRTQQKQSNRSRP